ncbi:MAG: SOUL family heme-binding protein [Paracoccaceae bacterium]
MRKPLIALALMAALAPGAASAEPRGGYETPPSAVERVIGDAYIRRTQAHLVAEVAVEGGRRAALARGFQILAGYIFGGNAAREGIAMTAPVTQAPAARGGSVRIDMTAPVTQAPVTQAPVTQEQGAEGIWTVRFAMPSEWTLETLPVPNDPRIRLVEAPAVREAVLAFSGRAGAEALSRAEAMLRAQIAAAGLQVAGPARHMHYDDPFTAPANRRTEVAIPLR